MPRRRPEKPDIPVEKLEEIAMFAKRCIDAINGYDRHNVALWLAIWDLRYALRDIDDFDHPEPGGSA